MFTVSIQLKEQVIQVMGYEEERGELLFPNVLQYLIYLQWQYINFVLKRFRNVLQNCIIIT